MSLQELLESIFKDVEQGKLSDRVFTFVDYKNKYVHLKPEVNVEVKFTDGKTATIDVTDYFKGVVK